MRMYQRRTIKISGRRPNGRKGKIKVRRKRR